DPLRPGTSYVEIGAPLRVRVNLQGAVKDGADALRCCGHGNNSWPSEGPSIDSATNRSQLCQSALFFFTIPSIHIRRQVESCLLRELLIQPGPGKGPM